MLNIFFWILLSIILYAYFGYGFVLLLLTGIKKLVSKRREADKDFDLPEVSLLIAAYNEKEVIAEKMENTLRINYPSDKLNVIWVTDGSNDGTVEELNKYAGITILHQPERKGKTAALNRAMPLIKTPFVVFSDANTLLDEDTIHQLITPFADERVGCVAGEKRIARNDADMAAGAGEGTYWQYESWIKRLESDLFSALAAAGELYAIRTNLFDVAPDDSIIDDFVISMNIAKKGYRIMYKPSAFAMENPSASIDDELKRKIRIASGGFQTLFRYPSLLNVFRHGFLSFEYISHKVIRWLLVPLSLPGILVLNLLICFRQDWQISVFLILLILQSVFYLLVLLGGLISRTATRMKFLFLPYYLIIMNYAQIAGLIRYFRKKHSVVWEKAQRA